jgi:hypothetical protein
MPRRWASVAASSRPALATAWGVVKAAVELVQGVGGCHRERALLIRGYGSFGRRHAARSEGLSYTQDQQHLMTATLHRGYDSRRW